MAMHQASAGVRDDPFGLLGGADSLAALNALQSFMAADATRATEPSRHAYPGDACFECAGELTVSDMFYECLVCHAVFEAANIQDVLPTSTPEVVGSGAFRGRLRLVGREASWFQPDLDRTNPSESSEVQKKSTYQELLKYNHSYASRGGNPFPLDVLNDVANRYYVVQQNAVKRSKMKRSILAALVFHSCIDRKFTRTKNEVADLLQLETHGIARGDDFLRSTGEDHDLEIDMNCDRLHPHITSVFAQLDLMDDAKTRPLRVAIAAVVKKAEGSNIGCQSVLRSKVIATTYEVLRRKGGDAVTLDAVSAKCQIRKHTIKQFLDSLTSYHSHFEEIYKSHGLDSSWHSAAEKKNPSKARA